jgi:hypothetical protein
VFVGLVARDVVGQMQTGGAATHQPACQQETPQVVAGDRWMVVTRGPGSAEEMRERTDGMAVPLAPGSTTFVSHALPCVGEAQPD